MSKLSYMHLTSNHLHLMGSLSNTTHQTEESSATLQATYAGAKRKIAALKLQLQNVQEAGRKRKSYVDLVVVSNCV